jgi:hypothetical protein
MLGCQKCLLVPTFFLVGWLTLNGQESSQSYKVQQNFTPWELRKNSAGYSFYQSVYQATLKKDTLLNKQLVWYFPVPPEGGNTDWSFYWIYWYNPYIQTIWARCPTPRHPQFKEWEQTLGKELWQIIPENKRIPGELSLSKLGPLFGPTFGSRKTGLPTVQKNVKDVINCVNFQDSVFN